MTFKELLAAIERSKKSAAYKRPFFRPRSPYTAYANYLGLSKTNKKRLVAEGLKKLQRWHVSSRGQQLFKDLNKKVGPAYRVSPEFVRNLLRNFGVDEAIKLIKSNPKDLTRYREHFAPVTSLQVEQFLEGIKRDPNYWKLTPGDIAHIRAIMESTIGKSQHDFYMAKMKVYQLYGLGKWS